MSDQGPRRYRLADYAFLPGSPPTRLPIRRILRAIVNAGCCLYAASVLGFWGAARWSYPAFWPTHLLLYGPRWLACLPVLLLAPLVIWLRLRWSGLELGIAVVSFLGIWGFNVPWRNLVSPGEESRTRLRVLTCNVQGRDLRRADLADLVRQERVGQKLRKQRFGVLRGLVEAFREV